MTLRISCFHLMLQKLLTYKKCVAKNVGKNNDGLAGQPIYITCNVLTYY